jgi:hypothetical protein
MGGGAGKSGVIGKILGILGLVTLLVAPAYAKDAAPKAPAFVNLRDGDAVAPPVVVKFSAPRHGHGHVHIIVDAPLPEAGEMVPMDERHIHLMHGEEQAVLQLPPGDHTLQLVMSGTGHRVGTPPVASPRITIHVREKAE